MAVVVVIVIIAAAAAVNFISTFFRFNRKHAYLINKDFLGVTQRFLVRGKLIVDLNTVYKFAISRAHQTCIDLE